MTTPNEPLESFQAWFSELTGRKDLGDALSWLVSGPSRYSLLKEAFYAGYAKRAGEEGSRNMLAIRAAEKLYPQPADARPGKFQGAQDESMRLAREYEDYEWSHRQRQKFVPTQTMPAIAAETGPQPALTHTGTVYGGWNAPDPVSPFFGDDDAAS